MPAERSAGRPMRCAVLGQPIAHSLSPVLHRAAYAALGLDWTYEAVELGPADLAGFLDGLGEEWRGLSLTMPLKRAVLPLLTGLDEWAALSGVANTVVLDSGTPGDERTGRAGHNTDIPGAIAAIRSRTERPLDRAVVLGGGATAASVLLALVELGCTSARLRVREPSRALDTLGAVARHPRAPRLEVEPLDAPAADADILVSTIPARAQTPDLVARWARVPVLFEVVYDGWPTPFATAAVEAGADLVSGLDLLVAQAALQVRLMTGAHDVPVDAMRAAGERELGSRG